MSLTRLDRRRRPLDHDPLSAPPERTIRAHRGLPDGRAVIGGLLVGIAALGTWWLSAGAGSDAPPSVVVARRAIAPGERIAMADLGLVPIELAGPVRAQAFSRPADVVGQVALGPLGPGSLVQASAIAAPPGRARARELSFAVDATWAVDGTLRPGERIDVFATTEDAAEPTRVVVRGATIRRIGEPGDGGLGAQPTQTITIAVDTEGEDGMTGLVNAFRTGTLTVARATGGLPGDAPSAAPTTTTTTTRPTTTTTAPRRPRPAAPRPTAPTTTAPAGWPFASTPS